MRPETLFVNKTTLDKITHDDLITHYKFIKRKGTSVIPIEVKAGKSGTLKSLHLFLREKHRPLGVRFNSDTPSLLDLKTTLPDGQNIPYRLLSLPLYMVGQALRLIRLCTSE